MKLQIVAVRDRAADVFGQPQFVAAVGVAIRGFQDEANREERSNQLFMHPEDFDLYHIGEYDDSDGSFVSWVPKMIAVGKDMKAPRN